MALVHVRSMNQLTALRTNDSTAAASPTPAAVERRMVRSRLRPAWKIVSRTGKHGLDL